MVLDLFPPWLFEPFARFALDTVGLWYIVTVVLMILPGALAQYFLGWETDDPFPDDYGLGMKLFTASILAPLLEETLFRILPVELGLSLAAIVAISVVWAALHGKRGVLILITVPLYVKMALAGMYVEMMLLHAFHNTWLVLLSHATESIRDDDTTETTDTEDLEEIEDSDELVDALVHKLEHDEDFDPKVTVNGTTYDSMDDVPTGELIELFGEDDE